MPHTGIHLVIIIDTSWGRPYTRRTTRMRHEIIQNSRAGLPQCSGPCDSVLWYDT
jgi:hypothetical protein